MHPAYDGLAALPFYDEFDLSQVDILLISQYVTFPTLKFPSFYGTALRLHMSMSLREAINIMFYSIAAIYSRPITNCAERPQSLSALTHLVGAERSCTEKQ